MINIHSLKITIQIDFLKSQKMVVNEMYTNVLGTTLLIVFNSLVGI